MTANSPTMPFGGGAKLLGKAGRIKTDTPWRFRSRNTPSTCANTIVSDFMVLRTQDIVVVVASLSFLIAMTYDQPIANHPSTSFKHALDDAVKRKAGI